MALAARLQLRHTQALVMTPQLMQSIRLLQFDHAELERFIDAEIEKNPLLERAGEDETGPLAARGQPDVDGDGPETGPEWSAEFIAERLDSSLENVFPDDPGVKEQVSPELAMNWKSAPGASGAGEGFDLEDFAAAAVSLREHVRGQIALSPGGAVLRAIAFDLADQLDEAGYLRADLDEVAARLGVSRAQVDAALLICQGLDPAGLFARDLGECLALQLAARDRLDPAMQALLGNLELLARRDFAALRRHCGVGEEDLLDMLAEIQALDPRPGAAFASFGVDAIVPDVEVRAAADGGWSIELNADALPKVLLDQTYAAKVAAHARTPAERDFLADCLRDANWLTRSLDQRARTILKVATEIVRQQDGFLAHGVAHLRPLNLRTVAEAVGLHESTVSRVTANKFMATPRGVFELRYFFTAAIAAVAGGEAHSAEAVRARIRQMIDAESAADVLSDDTIVARLKKDGVDIARRTVAKYREAMNIASSVERRREKRALAAVR